nr:cobalt ECF transporter T component CbiQ [uncultured Methanospirillum sp.]
MLENLLDSVAQESAFRHINPATKLLLALGSLILCLISQTPLVPIFSGVVLSLVLIFPAQISPSFYGKLLAGPAVFTGISVAILLFLTGGGETIWSFSPMPGVLLTISEGGIHQAVLILSRVFGCSISLFFLILTTPMTDLFSCMKKARVPVELIDLMMIIYRYIFIIYDLAAEIWLSQVMRLGYRRPVESVRSFSMLCGTLFISSWNAGEDLIHAMDCRCYSGVFPTLEEAEPIRFISLSPVLGYLGILAGLLMITHF